MSSRGASSLPAWVAYGLRSIHLFVDVTATDDCLPPLSLSTVLPSTSFTASSSSTTTRRNSRPTRSCAARPVTLYRMMILSSSSVRFASFWVTSIIIFWVPPISQPPQCCHTKTDSHLHRLVGGMPRRSTRGTLVDRSSLSVATIYYLFLMFCLHHHTK